MYRDDVCISSIGLSIEERSINRLMSGNSSSEKVSDVYGLIEL